MYLEYDFANFDEQLFERVTMVLELFRKSDGSGPTLWRELPEWAKKEFIDLSDPEQRLMHWGKRDMLNLDDPQDRTVYEEFRQKEQRWDWESWVTPLLEDFWQPQISDKEKIIRIAMNKFPSGVIGPLNYLVEIAGAEDLAPEVKFTPLKEQTP